jgi:hypothetical protein
LSGRGGVRGTGCVVRLVLVRAGGRWRGGTVGLDRWFVRGWTRTRCCSGGESEAVAAIERGDELVSPWPSVGDAECGLASGAGDQSGGVQQGVAKSFRFRSGEVTVEAQVLAPDQQVVGDDRGGEAGVVDGEVGGGEVGAAGVFEVADQFLGAAAAAL